MSDKYKKILVISNMYPSKSDPYYGTFVKEFYESLSKTPIFSTDIIAIKGRSFNPFSKLLKYILFYFKIFCKVTFIKYDIIYTHTISHPTPPLRIVSIFKKLNTVYNIHGDDLLTTTKLAARLLKFSTPLLSKSSLIVVPSLYFKEVLLIKMPWLINKNIFISPSGGVAEKFYNDSMIINSIPRIGYVSRIDEGKGWNTLIEALKILKENFILFQAEFYGRGDQCNDLLNKIKLYGLEDCVNYYGPKSHNELPSIYHSFDIFIFPTIRKAESLGLVGLEAMAASIPVIGSNIAGLKTYIINGKNGFLFSPGNSTSLAESIIRYLSMDNKSKLEMKKNAYITAISYKSELVNDILVKKLKELLC